MRYGYEVYSDSISVYNDDGAVLSVSGKSMESLGRSIELHKGDESQLQKVLSFFWQEKGMNDDD